MDEKMLVLMVLLNLASSITLAFGLKQPLTLLLILLNLPLLIRKPWSIVLMIVLLCISLITILSGLAYSLIRIEEVRSLLRVTGSLVFTGGYVTYSLFILSSVKKRKLFRKAPYRDPCLPEGWICPKCSSKMLFSVACWNCGFKVEDLNKPQNAAAPLPGKPETGKIDSYIRRKKGEGGVGNA